MVYFFSGTGNSKFVATTLANFLGMNKSFIPATKVEEMIDPSDNMLFVFPVYSWGVPPLIGDFIKAIPAQYWETMERKGLRVDCVMVCGDEVALAPEMFEKMLGKVGVKANSIRSIIMPNNYVLLPGFDVDSKKVEEQKLESSPGRIMEIAEGLSRGDRRIDVTRGKMAWLKTKLVYPLFKKWGIFPKNWKWTDACISCGKCAKACPLQNVKMESGHPVWGDNCCSCLGCYNVCPVHAVEYGKATLKKGQYFFPLRKISSKRCHRK